MNSRQPSYVRYACHLMKAWTWVAAAAALVGVGSVAGFGVVAHEELSALEHGPAYTLPAPIEVLEPAQGSPIESSSLHDAIVQLQPLTNHNSAFADVTRDVYSRWAEGD